MAPMPPKNPATDEQAHDVLAAEKFAMPAADPELHHRGPVQLPADPADPAGRTAPHDILAAEEFPMPAPRPGATQRLADRPGGARRLAIEVLVGMLFIRALLRRRSAG